MSKSIIQTDRTKCYLCGKKAFWNGNGMFEALEEHHVFNGNPDKKLSDKYGLTVYLHGLECHREGVYSVHKNRAVRLALQAVAQRKFEEVQGSHEDFVRIFRKNYL